VADAFAARIALYPADWHMLQRLWLADLGQSRLRAVDTMPMPADRSETA
jgi:lauroyl/myristoyl acyltransferase